MKGLGGLLEQIRKSKNISKQELCRRTGWNSGYVYKLENNLNHPSIDNVQKYCQAIGIEMSMLFYYAESEEKHEKINLKISELDNYKLVSEKK